MKRKLICLIVVVFSLCFSFTALANNEFTVYSNANAEHFCKAFNMTEAEIADYVAQNKITYLAINRDNTKQIKRSEITDAFSQRVIDFSVLENDEILTLTKEISGFENSKGEIVKIGDVKLLKTEVKTKDSGGEYVLTQFITVKNAKKITLSFFTAGDGDRAYIEAVLKEQFPKEKDFTPLIIGGIAVLSVAIVAVIVLIILEFRKKED